MHILLEGFMYTAPSSFAFSNNLFRIYVTHTVYFVYTIYGPTNALSEMVQLAEALRYKPEGRGFDFRWCNWNFLLT
jgi:hypothetical protein